MKDCIMKEEKDEVEGSELTAPVPPCLGVHQPTPHTHTSYLLHTYPPSGDTQIGQSTTNEGFDGTYDLTFQLIMCMHR